jgi:hypothetical protein
MGDSSMGRDTSVDRRTVLRTFGAAAVGAATVTETASARPGRGSLVSAVARNGHYAWFPGGPETWGRSQNPVEMAANGTHWAVGPARGGGIGCRIEGATFPQNAGFDVHLGQLGDVESLTVDARTTASAGAGPAAFVLGLYLDVDGDGDFFEWADGRGNTEQWVGFGGDGEGLTASTADGSYVLDDDTVLELLELPDGKATVGELKAGDVGGVGADTDAAVYLGVAAGGDAREAIVVDDVTVERA